MKICHIKSIGSKADQFLSIRVVVLESMDELVVVPNKPTPNKGTY